MLGTHVCLVCSLGRSRTVSGEVLAGSRVGERRGSALGQGCPYGLSSFSEGPLHPKCCVGGLAGVREGEGGLLKVSTRDPASLGLGSGLDPEDRLYGVCSPPHISAKVCAFLQLRVLNYIPLLLAEGDRKSAPLIVFSKVFYVY